MSTFGPEPACPVSIDRSFGPWAGPECRGGFDFTLLFEESILSIPVSSIFLLFFLPVELVRLAAQPVKVSGGLLGWQKTLASICYLGLSAALLGLWASDHGSGTTQTITTIPSAALTFVSSVAYAILSWLEHGRSIRPSSCLSAYLGVSILFDCARARTLWMLGDSRTIPAVFTASLAIRAIMLILESTEKRSILLPELKGCSHEVTSGPLNRGVFFWLSTLFLRGYSKVLSLNDLYPLDEAMVSEVLYGRLAEVWDKVPDRAAPGALFNAWLSAFGGPVMAAVIPKLLQIGFTYAQPFLITAAIELAVTPQDEPNNNRGYGLIGAYFLVYTGIAVTTGQYEWRMYRAASMMRGSMVPLIYQKSLQLDSTTSTVAPSAALTLMSTDIETIANGIVQLHETWGSLVEIALSMYLIWRQLGAACAMPIALSIAVMVGTGFLAVPTGKHQASWIQASQNRVEATSKTLGSIKSLRISGLNDMAFSVIAKLRSKELLISKQFRVLLGTSLMLAICTPVLGPVVTFSTYAGIASKSDGSFTIAQAFTAFSLIVLLNKPLAAIISALPLLAGAMASCQRIQDHLNVGERNDKRTPAGQDSNRSRGGIQTRESKSTKHLLEGNSPDDQYELAETIRAGSDSISTDNADVMVALQGKCSWKEDTEPVIDIQEEVHIPRRALTLVLGPVGCGKSTLLKALLGELSLFDGTVRTYYSGVAYCSQNAWLPNLKIRDIIIGHSTWDQTWYDAVVKACALETDMANWPQGDQTPVGTKGMSVSGGQSQRISIARAVYSRKDFIVLDDVFSGLDSNTEHLIFHNLFGENGLLRSARVTVVLASSNAYRVQDADAVLVLNEKGQVRFFGTPQELEPTVDIGARSGAGKARAEAQKAEPSAVELVPVLANADEIEAAANAARQLGNPAVYKFYGQAAGKFVIITFALSMLVFAFCDAFPSVWLKWWAESADPLSGLGKWIGVYVALGIGAVVACLIGTWQLLIVVINRTGLYFHDVLVEKVSRAPMSFHTTVDSGVTVNRFSQDLQLIDMELPVAALGTVLALCFGVAQFLLICVTSRYLGITIPFFFGSLYLVQHFYLRTSRQMRLLDIELKAPLYSQFIETIDGLATIRAFGWEDGSVKRNMAILNDSQRPSYILYCLQRWLVFSVDMLIMFLALILIILTTTLRQQIGPGFIGIALSNILAFSATMKSTITSWVNLEVSLGAVSRIRSFALDLETELPEKLPEAWSEPSGASWPAHGALELRGLAASYPSSGRVLNDISLSVQPGQKIGICGRTGSGKSSLTMCLLRMMDLDDGAILIDGVDTATLPPDFVRSRLVAIPQSAYIFDGTVRLNVDPAGAAADEEIATVLREVRLWARVEALGGLDATIEHGVLSQGQAQLLVLARAMLRKGTILILDEATSSLDKETSAIVDSVVKTWFADWTVLAIAHKLDSILDFDKVLVLDAGRVMEFDNPRKLLATEGSVFGDLYNLHKD
ncbi:hypothetical protein PspLS_09793 [Pyricularia sp. CBS 133598]|nr:hypothetical protein PspLS_09793 [Pyricularia sp. CBS 133598]